MKLAQLFQSCSFSFILKQLQAFCQTVGLRKTVRQNGSLFSCVFQGFGWRHLSDQVYKSFGNSLLCRFRNDEVIHCLILVPLPSKLGTVHHTGLWNSRCSPWLRWSFNWILWLDLVIIISCCRLL